MKRYASSSSEILRRVAYPVESFGFKAVPSRLSPLVVTSKHERLWQQPDLFGQVENCQADKFEQIQ
jgi:hypothetical protein